MRLDEAAKPLSLLRLLDRRLPPSRPDVRHTLDSAAVLASLHHALEEGTHGVDAASGITEATSTRRHHRQVAEVEATLVRCRQDHEAWGSSRWGPGSGCCR